MAPRYVSRSRVYASSIVFSCEFGIMRASRALRAQKQVTCIIEPPIIVVPKTQAARLSANIKHVWKEGRSKNLAKDLKIILFRPSK